MLNHDILRALDFNFQELAVKSEKSNFFIFSQKKPFGELFTKMTIKLSKEFLFLRNSAKCEMQCSGNIGLYRLFGMLIKIKSLISIFYRREFSPLNCLVDRIQEFT